MNSSPTKKTPCEPVSSRVSLERAISKIGFCSRRQARELIREGRVRVNGKIVLLPTARVNPISSEIAVRGQTLSIPPRVYLMLNKPRGLVTTRQDEQGRETVYRCFDGADLPWLFPVGRLDKASEGLLLFTNDGAWSDHLLDPANSIKKTYHVQINRVADEAFLQKFQEGIQARQEMLTVHSVQLLRKGARNSWLEIVLTEGKNRHIRRMLEALGIGVRRLVRIRLGSLSLGDLPRGQYRHLTAAERKEIIKNIDVPRKRKSRDMIRLIR